MEKTGQKTSPRQEILNLSSAAPPPLAELIECLSTEPNHRFFRDNAVNGEERYSGPTPAIKQTRL
ncbi:hypothetical protein RGCCGE502_21260 [Rhizobium grahamii CCGE 502]|uniref:Uncharacterized protein n=1 Tax=Rhizobium grahamii CCGE 502 TaxID=990285 RepID=S3HDX1_9HYPH|nr:hypothetical protein RGCCGE502_21260 [Rhizobium grahamii CCGE 502]